MLFRKNFFNFLLVLFLILLYFFIQTLYTDYTKINRRENEIRRSNYTLFLTGSNSGYWKDIKKYSDYYNVSPELVLAVMQVESNFNTNAVSHKGAKGLMQIMPSTGRWLADKEGLRYKSLHNPKYNIQLGAYYISILSKKHKGNVNKILAEYNGGGKAATYYPNVSTETSNYVKKVKYVYNKNIIVANR